MKKVSGHTVFLCLFYPAGVEISGFCYKFAKNTHR